ncbi:MAG TPA: hypothetical protein VHJ54_07555 [Solirubrobacterales bacterium]|jgi:ribosomal protein L12E/L44/L45/RPP1/RPP2|nr:hypothetical protein [Solirubrobacterales bacterium]
MVALESLGIEADEAQMRELVAAIKQRALKTKALLPLEEVVRLAGEVLGTKADAPALVAD